MNDDSNYGHQRMRIFKKYLPRLIARHVRTLFKGRMYIEGRGAYEFANGVLLMPDHADLKHTLTVNELNSEIMKSRKVM